MSLNGQVLLTGASGFVGSAVARKLVEAGFAVRALVRPTSPRFHLGALDLQFDHRVGLAFVVRANRQRRPTTRAN